MMMTNHKKNNNKNLNLKYPKENNPNHKDILYMFHKPNHLQSTNLPNHQNLSNKPQWILSKPLTSTGKQ